MILSNECYGLHDDDIVIRITDVGQYGDYAERHRVCWSRGELSCDGTVVFTRLTGGAGGRANAWTEAATVCDG